MAGGAMASSSLPTGAGVPGWASTPLPAPTTSAAATGTLASSYGTSPLGGGAGNPWAATTAGSYGSSPVARAVSPAAVAAGSPHARMYPLPGSSLTGTSSLLLAGAAPSSVPSRLGLASSFNNYGGASGSSPSGAGFSAMMSSSTAMMPGYEAEYADELEKYSRSPAAAALASSTGALGLGARYPLGAHAQHIGLHHQQYPMYGTSSGSTSMLATATAAGGGDRYSYYDDHHHDGDDGSGHLGSLGHSRRLADDDEDGDSAAAILPSSLSDLLTPTEQRRFGSYAGAGTIGPAVSSPLATSSGAVAPGHARPHIQHHNPLQHHLYHQHHQQQQQHPSVITGFKPFDAAPGSTSSSAASSPRASRGEDDSIFSMESLESTLPSAAPRRLVPDTSVAPVSVEGSSSPSAGWPPTTQSALGSALAARDEVQQA
ncbi:hypothetical protein BC828DRAFT_387794 [Blastocladiella britannica]|nr:hypothetical protein BC828DRAFT_387794 [Blastocladiella britannica]